MSNDGRRHIQFDVNGNDPNDIDDLGELLMEGLVGRDAIDPVVNATDRHMEVEWREWWSEFDA